MPRKLHDLDVSHKISGVSRCDKCYKAIQDDTDFYVNGSDDKKFCSIDCADKFYEYKVSTRQLYVPGTIEEEVMQW